MRCVMFPFLSAGIVGALLVLVEHVSGVADITRFPQIVSNQVLNMFIGMLSYAPTLAVVPIALFLLARTGQTRSVLGIGVPSWKEDIFPALGIGAAAFGVEILLFIPFAGLLSDHPGLLNSVADGNFPKYYLIEGIFMSAVTAVTEEVLVNGYFLTRLQQLGWSPRSALIVSLVFRTSYHVYYGIGFLFTIPFGYFVTRSFQKHQRLNRPIWAHFLYDAILFSISILK
jgi:membrane protease YdiL (CAAX protease family)